MVGSPRPYRNQRQRCARPACQGTPRIAVPREDRAPNTRDRPARSATWSAAPAPPSCRSVPAEERRVGQRNSRDPRSAELTGEPGQRRLESSVRERPVVLARLSDDRAVNAVGAAERTQRIGSRDLIARVGCGLAIGQAHRTGIGDREVVRVAATSLSDEIANQPATLVVVAVPVDHRARVERRPGVGVSAEQPGDGLRLVARHSGSSHRRHRETR